LRDTTRPRVGLFSRLRDDIKVVLIHGGDELVQQFDPKLRQHALKSLRRQGVDVRLNTYVEECGDGFLRLKDKHTGKQELLLNGLTVWAAGVGPVPFVEKLLDKLPSEACGPNGRILIDQWMRCKVPQTVKTGSVLILGDAAAYSSDNNKGYLPQTAQVAGQQGAFVARLLDRSYNMTMTPPAISKTDMSPMSVWMRIRGLKEAACFDFLNLGLLAYVGGSEALSQIEIGDVPILSYAGSISFILWRSVYLVKQVATRNRVLVTFDWIKSFIFGRDVTRL
jgi:NADH dehydrogenase FAD-containing subunit